MERNDQSDEKAYTLSTRASPRSHSGADPVICDECREVDLLFFDPSCLGCLDILKHPKTSISQIFAIIRQWVPQTQQNIDLFVKEIFSRGAHVNDKDGLTDMTLLHYAAKSGANGVGDVGASLAVVKFLIEKGVDINAKCTWTDMSALHYAVFFDIEPVVEYLLLVTNGENIDTNCREFDDGTALHIGCTNLCVTSVKTLIRFGANPHYLNKFGKPPVECIPNDDTSGNEPLDSASSTLKDVLKIAMQDSVSKRKHNLTSSTLQALGLELHTKVVVSGNVGMLRFCGPTDFASGQWAGIELDEPLGKNDGSVAGIKYFSCQTNHGVFAPLARIHKYDGKSVMPLSSSSDSGRTSSSASNDSDVQIGDTVDVDGQKAGIVRYIGSTKFAAGTWIGIEADKACGKNDGTIAGIQYFQCKHKHGIFVPLTKVRKTQDNEKGPTKVELSLQEREENENESEGKEELNTTKAETAIPVLSGNKKVKKKISTDSSPSAKNSKNSNLSKQKKSKKNEKTFGAEIEFMLKTGMSVYVNNEMGIIRYIGPVDFAESIWLGIELRTANGKNDGMVGNKRYFTCKSGHGLMVRPNRATCRGINCAHLIDPKLSMSKNDWNLKD